MIRLKNTEISVYLFRRKLDEGEEEKGVLMVLWDVEIIS